MAPDYEPFAGYGLAVAYALDEAVANNCMRVLSCRRPAEALVRQWQPQAGPWEPPGLPTMVSVTVRLAVFDFVVSVCLGDAAASMPCRTTLRKGCLLQSQNLKD